MKEPTLTAATLWSAFPGKALMGQLRSTAGPTCPQTGVHRLNSGISPPSFHTWSPGLSSWRGLRALQSPPKGDRDSEKGGITASPLTSSPRTHFPLGREEPPVIQQAQLRADHSLEDCLVRVGRGGTRGRMEPSSLGLVARGVWFMIQIGLSSKVKVGEYRLDSSPGRWGSASLE